MAAPQMLPALRTHLGTVSGATLVFAVAVGIALLSAFVSTYRRRIRTTDAEPSYRQLAYRTGAGALAILVSVLAVSIGGGIDGVTLVATPAALGIDPTAPWLVGVGAVVGVVIVVTEYGLHLTLGLLGLSMPDHALSYADSFRPETRRDWVVHLGGVAPLFVVANEVLFRAAIVGAGTAAGFATPSVFGLSILLYAATFAWSGLRNSLVMAFTGTVLALAFVLTGLLVPVVAGYVAEMLRGLSNRRYFADADA